MNDTPNEGLSAMIMIEFEIAYMILAATIIVTSAIAWARGVADGKKIGREEAELEARFGTPWLSADERRERQQASEWP